MAVAPRTEEGDGMEGGGTIQARREAAASRTEEGCGAEEGGDV